VISPHDISNVSDPVFTKAREYPLFEVGIATLYFAEVDESGNGKQNGDISDAPQNFLPD
jgi:hypothetical protein